MSFKTITTVLCDIEKDRDLLETASDLALRENAHLDVICLGLDRTQPGFYYAGTNAMVLQDNLQQARAESLALEKETAAVLENSDVFWATHAVTAQMIGLSEQIGQLLRFSDLVVLPRPYGTERGHESEEILEAALFASKVPVLVAPDRDAPAKSAERVVVAWNESPEALGAIRAALPLLKQAKCVDVVVIDPPVHGPHRSDPGGALCQMLVRHGIRAEVSVLAKTLPRVSDVLCRHMQDKDADLLVMGAYGHSRFRESLLGGATRNMLEMASGPVFMTH